ncbi:LysR family transcriptional regulator [Sphingomonas oryzagri]|jgi:LysR family carnitine catabolism transcriptional activator|uniref:LysR family transcriptional regulator n=1 Tax=Sphingomonas oryzagri TaxID=3042314 RepID=A0ABT6MXD5_9SPHN|nr:LysR family transcriptional regulator [Sphingomonas oryzagri]MDH7637705.1 LysR family transcriptional regulator [Sphingomonas oryzagri]
MSRLTLSQLSAFMKLAETSSFKDAATQLGVSQPALSRTIQHIETRVGVRLFDRDTRTVTLTPAGERLRPSAARLLEDYETVFRELREFVEGREGIIRIATLPSVASAVLPGAIQRFQPKFPGVRIEIWEDVGEQVHNVVREGTADFAIAPPPDLAGDLRYQELLKDSIVLACRQDDPLAAIAEHNWSSFEGCRLVTMSPETGLRKMVESGLAQSGVVVERMFNCSAATTVGALVNAGQGITALTRLTMAQIASPSLVWRPLVDPALARSIGVVRHKARSLSPAAQAFTREVEQQARVLRMGDLAPSALDLVQSA